MTGLGFSTPTSALQGRRPHQAGDQGICSRCSLGKCLSRTHTREIHSAFTCVLCMNREASAHLTTISSNRCSRPSSPSSGRSLVSKLDTTAVATPAHASHHTSQLSHWTESNPHNIHLKECTRACFVLACLPYWTKLRATSRRVYANTYNHTRGRLTRAPH